jgi:hypothetical protein
MAISDANKARLNKMNRAAQDAALGTVIQTAQNDIDTLEVAVAVAASTTVAGNVELATSAEAITGTDEARAVTPKALADAATTHVSAATVEAAGKVELATDAETLAGTDTGRAVTPSNLASVISQVEIISFQGVGATGPCVAVGLNVGDDILSVTGGQAGVVGDQGANFEGVVTVDDQIQQTSNDNLAANTYLALVLRKS